MNFTVETRSFQEAVSNFVFATKKSVTNQKAGWLSLSLSKGDAHPEETLLTIKAGSLSHYMECVLSCEGSTEPGEDFITIEAANFIPLVSKIDEIELAFEVRLNCLILKTSTSEYTFPLIKNNGTCIPIDTLDFHPTRAETTLIPISGSSIKQVIEKNLKGFAGAQLSSNIMNYVYIDNKGAITYTSNIYVNSFKEKIEQDFQIMLLQEQIEMLKVFENFSKVFISIQEGRTDEESQKVAFYGKGIDLILVMPSKEIMKVFPVSKLREVAEQGQATRITLSKSVLEKALSRLMVFDKRFDAKVLDYSQFEFGTESVKLVSINNRNYEVIPYVSVENPQEHTSIIRFADILAQIGAISSSTVEISFGEVPVVMFNSPDLVQIIPEVYYG